MDAYVAPLLEMRDFSGTVLVARRGKVLVARGYGFADFERKVAASEETVYAVGSITKTFTAALVLGLAGPGGALSGRSRRFVTCPTSGPPSE